MKTLTHDQAAPRGTDGVSRRVGQAWATWAPPVLAGVVIGAVELAARAGCSIPFGLAFPGAGSARESADAWLCLVTLTGVGAVLSWYGVLALRARRAEAASSARRAEAAALAFGLAIVLVVWAFTAGDRFGDAETIVGWTIGAHLPTLAFCYGLVGYGVARMPRRRTAMAVLAGWPLLLAAAQASYLPAGSERSVTLGFILNSGVIAVAIAVRLAIWLRYEEPASRTPGR